MGKQCWKVIFSFLLGLCVLVHVTSLTAQANTPLERVNLALRDVHEASWAEREIREMSLRGIISGYADGTFRPNQAVSKLEALVMAVRALGLEREAERLAKESDPQFYLFQGQGLDWAKGYLRAAYNHGLIQHYMQEHNWQEPANRAWMAQLMVRLLGKEEEALELPFYSLSFTDEKEIMPRSLSKYIAVSMRYGLLSGYPDRTFRPNQPITRAELAVLLSKYHERYVEDYSLQKVEYAIVYEIDWDSLEIILRLPEGRDQVKKYRLHPDAPLFLKKDKQLIRQPLSYLEKNQMIHFLEHNNQVLLIEVINEGYPHAANYNHAYRYGTEYLVGFIVSVAPDGQSVTLEDFQGKRYTYPLANQVEILRLGQKITGQQLNAGEMYTYQLADNKLTRLEYQPSEKTTFTGEVMAFNEYLSELHVYHQIEGRSRYGNDARTFYLPKGYQPPVRRGDYVRVYAYGQFVYDLELISTTYMEGYFREYDEDNHELTIVDLYGKRHTFRLVPTRDMLTERERENRVPYLRIHVPGAGSDSLGALHYNDLVQLTFDVHDQNNNQNKLEVLSIQVINQLQGTIEQASYSTLTVRNPYGYTLRYSFSESPRIRVIGISGPAKRSDLRVHDKINFRVERGEVVEVHVYERSEDEGTILNVKDNQITLLNRQGQMVSYVLNNRTQITWHDYRNLSRNQLKTGQKVKFWLDGELLTEIRLLDEGMVTGLLVDHSRDSVWLRTGEDEERRFMLAERHRISSSRGSGTRLEDLQDKLVTLVFAESKVASIMEEAIQEKEYLVIDIDASQRSIRLHDDERKQYVYRLPDTIHFDGKDYTPEELAETISFRQRIRPVTANQYVLAIK